MNDPVLDNFENVSVMHWFRVRDIEVGTRSTGRDHLSDTFRESKALNIGEVLNFNPDSNGPDTGWWMLDGEKNAFAMWYHESWLEPV